MKYGAQLKKIRRYLRDPKGNIWESTYLRTVYNDIQRELQHLTGFLENVEAIRVPSLYQYSYLYEWEWRHLPGDQSRFFRCLRFHQQGGYAFCNRWEMQTEFGLSGVTGEDGALFTHPWEAWADTPGEAVKCKYPEDFYRSKLMAFDNKPLDYIDKKTITQRDPSYKSRSTEPYGYYRESDLDDDFVLYPRPSSITWNDVLEQSDPDWVYNHSWESTSFPGTGETFTRTDSTNNREYLYIWELTLNTDDDYGMRGMYLFELSFSQSGQYGMVLYVVGEATGPIGTFESRTGTLFNQDEGIAISVVDSVDNVLLIYDAIAKDIQDEQDTSDFPEFMQKYNEIGTLSRAYGANTDGKIKSLQDYWEYRYQVGIEMMKKFMKKRKSDRDYQLVTGSLPVSRKFRHARLPDTYPN